LKAEAEALVEEMEPGDIQFDDESGEGGTVTVDRERDLVLSAQALRQSRRSITPFGRWTTAPTGSVRTAAS
jgi:hypothetical protein